MRNVLTYFEAKTIEVAVKDCVKDTDKDGTPDYLDKDSDNDGCPDAIEGGTNDDTDPITKDKLTGETLGNDVNADGVPKVDGNAVTQTVGSSKVKDEFTIAIASDKGTQNVVCYDKDDETQNKIVLTATATGKRTTDFGTQAGEADDTLIDIPEEDYNYQWYEVGGNDDGTDKKLTDGGDYAGATTNELTVSIFSSK